MEKAVAESIVDSHWEVAMEIMGIMEMETMALAAVVREMEVRKEVKMVEEALKVVVVVDKEAAERNLKTTRKSSHQRD